MQPHEGLASVLGGAFRMQTADSGASPLSLLVDFAFRVDAPDVAGTLAGLLDQLATDGELLLICEDGDDSGTRLSAVARTLGYGVVCIPAYSSVAIRYASTPLFVLRKAGSQPPGNTCGELLAQAP